MYECYINERHADGDMYPATLDQFEKFSYTVVPVFIELWKDSKTDCRFTCDLMDDGLSAGLHFLIPDEQRRSWCFAVSQIQISKL